MGTELRGEMAEKALLLHARLLVGVMVLRLPIARVDDDYHLGMLLEQWTESGVVLFAKSHGADGLGFEGL